MLFSIIVPTRNRPASLDRCLQALSKLTFPLDQFEVLVIDDGGTSVEPVIGRHAAALPVRLLTQPRRGPAVARNFGLRESAWGGAIEPAPENGICGNTSQLLITFLYNPNHARAPFYCTNNIAFPRRELQALGGFDETFPLAAAEDRDLCDRWSGRAALRYEPRAIVVHLQMLTFAGFWRQHYRYGRGAFHFHHRRRQRGMAGLRVAPFRFYSQMLMSPWSAHPPATAAALCALLLLSQVATAAGFLFERSRPRS